MKPLKSLSSLALLALAAGALATTAPAQAAHTPTGRGHWGESQAFRVQLGVMTPRGESAYWNDKSFDFSGDAEDFENGAAGLEYIRFLGGRLGFVASTNFFAGTDDQFYLDFVDEFGGDIYHTTDLEMTSFNLGLLLALTRRDAAVIPYVGAGGGFNAWRLTEYGDFIDFGFADPEIFGDEFYDEGVALGYYLQAGVEVPLGRNFSAYAEGRWTRAEDDLGADFEGLGELDLSGRMYSAGLSWSF